MTVRAPEGGSGLEDLIKVLIVNVYVWLGSSTPVAENTKLLVRRARPECSIANFVWSNTDTIKRKIFHLLV